MEPTPSWIVWSQIIQANSIYGIGGCYINGLWEIWKWFARIFFKLMIWIDVWSTSCEIDLRWLPHTPVDDKSTLVQVKAWCRQALTSQIVLTKISNVRPYGVTRQVKYQQSPSQYPIRRLIPQNIKPVRLRVKCSHHFEIRQMAHQQCHRNVHQIP